MRILVLDPGNSTGWVLYDSETKQTVGGTFKEDFLALQEVFESCRPDLVIYESFALYPGLAKSMSWNTFYPCEIIGVIKYLAIKYMVNVKNQSPSVKKYAGKVNFKDIEGTNITIHTKDAYLHLAYYLRIAKNEMFNL